MALCLLKRAGLLVTLTPAVYVGLCACGTIGEVASRYINSAFVGDPVVKEEISKLYGWVQTKQKSSEPLYQLIDKEERAAFVRGEVTYELLPAVEKIADKLEAKMAFNIWKQNCRRSMIANFQRRLKYPILMRRIADIEGME